MIKKEKWIIDTDPGCDDIMAILYILNRPEVELEFISLSEGNCKMNDVIKNIKKIRVMYGKNFLVYPGCDKQLCEGSKNAYDYHFSDGLGNINKIKEINIDDVEISENKSPIEIVKSINKNPGEINLLLLASMTNISIAFMLDPSINKKIKNIVVMGGSYNWRGNVSPVGEFNFVHDYFSTNLFFRNFENSLITGWEPTEYLFFNVTLLEKSKNIAIEKFGGYNENLYVYLYLIIEKYTDKRLGTQICDLYAIIAYFEKKSVNKYFVSDVDVIIDSQNMNGGIILKNKLYPDISFTNIFNEYYLQKSKYLNRRHFFIDDFNLDVIVEEFSYILRPK